MFQLSRQTFTAQAMIAALTLTLVVAAPPARGNTLLVPLHGQTRGKLYALAIASGALPLAAGPGRASLIVRAGHHMLPPIIADGVLPIAAPFATCGDIA